MIQILSDPERRPSSNTVWPHLLLGISYAQSKMILLSVLFHFFCRWKCAWLPRQLIREPRASSLTFQRSRIHRLSRQPTPHRTTVTILVPRAHRSVWTRGKAELLWDENGLRLTPTTGFPAKWRLRNELRNSKVQNCVMYFLIAVRLYLKILRLVFVLHVIVYLFLIITDKVSAWTSSALLSYLALIPSPHTDEPR